ncbi:hypothetical protein [Parafilimonas terrae]|uniref:Uncharacterized protein n=1 Tax=Parafilimonas terrae TaxID=1465490 RepID=A0A1I5VZJ7_9BACT|nr:hypothetical protein [Parafilimonas terrae]SFQ12853.1 hypothetical protein SAMN05444277_105278 [Parafilimonas terrae]
MIAANNKAFNEIFLTEISKFDSRKYAYDTFFNCDEKRFSKIARQYGIQNGSGALNYMLKTFYSWKSNHVRPNGSSSYNIVASTAATFTIEEKFIEAYTQLAKHIKHSFPKKIELKDVNQTFSTILTNIETFNLEKTSYYSRYIYKGDELENYQEYVKRIFEFYTKMIFENLNNDIPLFKKTYTDVNTAFLEIKFNTYLYNIEINIQGIAKKIFAIKKVFDLPHPISYEELINDNLSDFSLEQITEIAKANNTTKIDAFLTEFEIGKIVDKKKEIENSKRSGNIQYTLKSNSGILTINLRILSPTEKLLIALRILLFIAAAASLIYYCFFFTQSYFIFIVGLFVSSFLISPIYDNIVKLFKDTFK